MRVNKRKRNYEKYAEPAPSFACRLATNPGLTIASILKSSIFDSLSHECTLLRLTEGNYVDILCNKEIDLVLIDSTFADSTDDWSNRVAHILDLCQEREIISAFWDTETFLDESVELMKRFEFIFTINSSRIDEYKKVFENERVFFLPFAVQPRIYNPIERNIANKEEIFSRKLGIELTRVQGTQYKLYKLLCKKAIQNGFASIPKEVFELLATGTTLVSPYSDLLAEFFPQILKLYPSDAEMQEIVAPLLKDKTAIDKLSILGQRCVFTSHTYASRIDTILQKTGLLKQHSQQPGITMVTSTNRPDSMENVFRNYENQIYNNKELIVVLNNNKMDLEEWKSKAQEYENVRVYQIDEQQPLGRCLNHAIDQSDFPYFSKCDDDNYYAPNFLSDLMNAYQYADAEIVGKLTYYCYLEGCRTLAMMCPDMEYRYVNMLSGSALIIKREVFESVRFRDKPFGSDTVFLRECMDNGVRMYSADRFNYVYKRHPSQENHTWKAADDVFLRSCKVVDVTDDFTQIVTV